MADPTPALDLRTGSQRIFLHLLVSTLVVSVMNFTAWFAVTFWVYLETSSVFATGLIAGIFLVSIAVTGIWLADGLEPGVDGRLFESIDSESEPIVVEMGRVLVWDPPRRVMR